MFLLHVFCGKFLHCVFETLTFVLCLYKIANCSRHRHHYEERSLSSRTVLLSKHTVTAENQNYYEVVLPLLYITWDHGLIFDVTLGHDYY